MQTTNRTVKVDNFLAQALFNLRRHLLCARPREVRLSHPHPPLVFVDGAFETDKDGVNVGSIGGLILDPVDMAYEFFSLQLSTSHVQFLLGIAGKTAIFQLELLPVLVARHLWSDRCKDRAIIVFCDNEAAKSALVAGYTAQPVSVRIVSRVADLDVRDGALTWYERVPSFSNPADAPSRLLSPPVHPAFSYPRKVAVDAPTHDFL